LENTELAILRIELLRNNEKRRKKREKQKIGVKSEPA